MTDKEIDKLYFLNCIFFEIGKLYKTVYRYRKFLLKYIKEEIQPVAEKNGWIIKRLEFGYQLLDGDKVVATVEIPIPFGGIKINNNMYSDIYSFQDVVKNDLTKDPSRPRYAIYHGQDDDTNYLPPISLN